MILGWQPGLGLDARDILAASVVTSVHAVLARTDVAADARGYRELLEFTRRHVLGARCWAWRALDAVRVPAKRWPANC